MRRQLFFLDRKNTEVWKRGVNHAVERTFQGRVWGGRQTIVGLALVPRSISKIDLGQGPVYNIHQYFSIRIDFLRKEGNDPKTTGIESVARGWPRCSGRNADRLGTCPLEFLYADG
jgi:hypothetical protein